MILALHDSKANDRIVCLAKRLIEPLIGTRRDQGRYVHYCERILN